MTWDVEHEIVLAPSHCGDLGYPASCVLPDDTLVTVFYQQPAPGERQPRAVQRQVLERGQ